MHTSELAADSTLACRRGRRLSLTLIDSLLGELSNPIIGLGCQLVLLTKQVLVGPEDLAFEIGGLVVVAILAVDQGNAVQCLRLSDRTHGITGKEVQRPGQVGQALRPVALGSKNGANEFKGRTPVGLKVSKDIHEGCRR